jgi:hypothetical protein
MDVDPFKPSVEPVLEQAIHFPYELGQVRRVSVTNTCIVRHVTVGVTSYATSYLPHAFPVGGGVFFFKKVSTE